MAVVLVDYASLLVDAEDDQFVAEVLAFEELFKVREVGKEVGMLVGAKAAKGGLLDTGLVVAEEL